MLCIEIITVTSEDFDQILESGCLNEFFLAEIFKWACQNKKSYAGVKCVTLIVEVLVIMYQLCLFLFE